MTGYDSGLGAQEMSAIQGPAYGSDFDRGTWVSEPSRRVQARRSHLEMVMDILAVVKAGSEKPTQIMYKANLSWVALQMHLKQLLERGLLRWAPDGERKRYELTVRGAAVMYAYAKIVEEMGEDASTFLGSG